MYLISEWAILNDITSKQLRRTLAFHQLSESEIFLACTLLESYHAVYRRDRLLQRQNLIKSAQARLSARYLHPTTTQLHEIAQKIHAKISLQLGTEEVLDYLQNLAKYLQEYCLNAREGLKKTASRQKAIA